jgi:two-component system phosphate regulon sensor histidine kinase PhoR
MISGTPRPLLRSRFFWNLFASFTGVLLATALSAAWLAERRLEAVLLDDLASTLEEEARLFAPTAGRALTGQAPALQAELEGIGRESELRITVIRADGTVIGDSDEEPARMDDHGNRPEVVAARTQPYGLVRRRSHTVGQEVLYLARRVEREGELLGFVRVALPISVIERERAVARDSILLGTAAGSALALLAGFLLSRRFMRPIVSMTRMAEDLRAGQYESRVQEHRRDELGLLGEALNALGSELAQKIAALSQEDAQLRAMLAGMVEGVVAVDAQDRIAFINDAARMLLGMSAGDSVGRTLWDLAPVRELEELLRRARASGLPERREIELYRGGRERVFQAHASPFQGGEGQDDRKGFVIVLHDTTELRKLERIRRDFVANVSHELKTPLASIQGFVETLLTGAIHDQEHNVRFLERIQANVKRLTNLVTDLLSLARIETGQLEIQRSAVEWGSVLDDVLRLRESTLQAKGLRLEVVGREHGLRVRGDREAMTQVLHNLIDNAIQYTPAPGRITVRFSRRGEQGLLSVEDTGIGIPSGDLERIFERFYRVDKARSRAAGGTGLGLSIVKNLVLRMEGEVTVTSEEGRGSVFSVALPLA